MRILMEHLFQAMVEMERPLGAMIRITKDRVDTLVNFSENIIEKKMKMMAHLMVILELLSIKYDSLICLKPKLGMLLICLMICIL